MKKLHKNGGFTLVEMLIVVAIIAILIAISIPLVNSALEKSRDNTDLANERACKAEAVLYVMGMGDAAGTIPDPGTKMRYDAKSGELVSATTTVDPYGQCTQGHDDSTMLTDDSGPHKGMWIEVTFGAAAVAGGGGTGGTPANYDLEFAWTK